jgi:hypothetical protein
MMNTQHDSKTKGNINHYRPISLISLIIPLNEHSRIVSSCVEHPLHLYRNKTEKDEEFIHLHDQKKSTTIEYHCCNQ